MKVSLNWVKEFTPVELSVDELVAKIGAQLGAVEEVVDLGKKYQDIVIAKVVSCIKHPNADKLKVCKVDDGGATKEVKRDENGLVEVVCGAPNVREGMLVAWLPPGTVVPSTHDKDPLKLEARDIRGVVSNGMLASQRELALGDNHDGILEIDNTQTHEKTDPAIDQSDHVAALSNIVLRDSVKPGDDFAQTYGLDDYIIDIENKMFTHRPDLFGQLGVAREIAGITGQKFTSPSWYLRWGKATKQEAVDSLLEIHNEIPNLVPRFSAQILEGISVKSSSVRLQAYLSRVGLRPINNIVDITNYMMILTGQPMHAYDYDKVKTLSSTDKAVITIRHPKQGEKLTLLSGKVVEPRSEAIVIATDKVAIGIGGVMGGADTEVDERTESIILECANFDMYSIRRTAMAHGLFTDAVTRFTKGQSPWQTSPVLAWATNQIICETGGSPLGTVYDVGSNDLSDPSKVTLASTFINSRLGVELPVSVSSKLLENVEFENTYHANTEMVGEITFGVPFWRTDITIEEDIVEEVGRLYGYDKLPLELPRRSLVPARKDSVIGLKSHIREQLSRSGANEMLTYSFIHGNLLDKVGQDKGRAFKLANALSPELEYYRMSLTPSLLDKVHPNIKAGYGELALFEINKIHMKDQMDETEPELPKEDTHVAFVFAANEKVAASNYSGAAYFQAKKYLERLAIQPKIILVPLVDFDFKDDEWGAQMVSPYEPNRSAVIARDGIAWGVVGEFKRPVRQALKLPDFAAGFEVAIDVLGGSTVDYVSLPRFPKVEQDISLRVPYGLTYKELYEFLSTEIDSLKPKDTLVRLFPIDIFQRDNDMEHKQVAFRLAISAYDRTLTTEAVNTVLDRTAQAAHEKYSAVRI